MIKITKSKTKNPHLNNIVNKIISVPYEYLSQGGDAETFIFQIKSTQLVNNIILKPGKYVIKVYFIDYKILSNTDIDYFKKLSSKKLIPKIYDIDKHYIIMSFVEGIPLKDLIKDKKLSPGRWDKILRMIYKEVDTWHSKKFAHGDLNPGNIIIQKDTVVLIDPSTSKNKFDNDNDHLLKLRFLIEEGEVNYD